tara:strand:+ start:21895 stop:22797 length:903 start_codon:yes stop_codon:yes gene_type:complete
MTNYLSLFTAILLACVAAYFSVVGLSTIFAGAFWSVIIMGGTLEFAKLVSAAWLHLYWKVAPRAIKYYLTLAVAVLMLITSMGIFGFLSKAHIDSQVKVADNDIEVVLIDQRIERERKTISFVDSQLSLLDNASEEWIANGYVTRAINQRQESKDERATLLREQDQAAEALAELLSKRAELNRETVRQQAEIGPIKYVAEVIYKDEADSHVDDAARWVIFAIIFAFDPVAVLLLVGSIGQLSRRTTYTQNIDNSYPSEPVDDSRINISKEDIDTTMVDLTSQNSQRARNQQEREKYLGRK